MNENFLKKVIFPMVLVIAWLWMALYTFNEKPDLNGDNFCYFIYASSLADGHGYCDLSTPNQAPTSTWPPGYPLLMTPLRMITDSVVAQKWLNELFVLGSILLLYFILLRLGIPLSASFTAALSCVFLPRLWHFSTMMMAEASALFISVVVLYALVRLSEKEDSWYSELKNPWLYIMIAMLILCYHVRTQEISLVAGVGLCLLFRKRWGALLVTAGGFAAGCLPWIIRNKMLNLSSDRYLNMIMDANSWRPEEGTLTIGEVISRFFETLKMLVFDAIPNTVVPFVNVDCDNPSYSVGLYILGVLLLVLIGIGCWKMANIRWAMIGYLLATLGVISLFSTPSGNRYLTALLPLFSAALFIGIWQALTWLIQRKWADKTFPAYILILLCLFAKPGLIMEHEISNQKYPLSYRHFFQIGKELGKSTPEGTVICSRKPQMLYMYSHRPGVVHLFTQDDKELIQHLIDKNVDYVILDALGYSSTGLYLFPALQKNAQYFDITTHYEQTHTYLLKFNREQASKDLSNL